MGWPQYTWLALAFLGLGVELAKHGESKTGLGARHHAGWGMVGVLFSYWLLCSGGFFG